METGRLRRAGAEDLDTIMDIIAQAQRAMAALGIDQWQDGYPERAVFEQDMEWEQCYVYPGAAGPEGVMVVSFRPEPCYDALTGGEWLSHGAPYATIHRMAVRADRRGTGTAAEMLSGVLALCRAAGVEWLRADTHRGNVVMRRFLERGGFTPCGTVAYHDVHAGDPLRLAYERRVEP